MLKILPTEVEEAASHSVSLDSLKRAGNSPLFFSQNSKTFKGTVIVATRFKYFVNCVLGVTFDVSWFPCCLLLAYFAPKVYRKVVACWHNLFNTVVFQLQCRCSCTLNLTYVKKSFQLLGY